MQDFDRKKLRAFVANKNIPPLKIEEEIAKASFGENAFKDPKYYRPIKQNNQN